MQFSTVLAIVTAMASSAAASPTAAKRSFAPGQCGIHIVQKTEANAEDYVTFTVKDANGDEIGDSEGGLSAPNPRDIQSYLPDAIHATQPNQSHDIDMTYQDQSFGTEGGCSVGKWDDGDQGTRQWDCGFSC